MPIGIYSDIMRQDGYYLRWAQQQLDMANPVPTEIPQWGWAGYGYCNRCSHYNDLWTHSIEPTIMDYSEVGSRCLGCAINRLEWVTDMNQASNWDIGYLLTHTPNDWDIEDFERCVSCSFGFPNTVTDSLRYSPIDVLTNEGGTVKVHTNCRWTCGRCDKSYLNSYGNARSLSIEIHDVENENICDNCYHEYVENAGGLDNLNSCNNCSTTITIGEEYEWLGYDYCYSCYESYAHECDDCSQEFFGDWSDHDCPEDDDYNSQYIHNYSYKPRPFFFGKGEYHLGFELEVEARNTQPHYGAEKVVNTLGSRAYCKEDGSLNHGFEIVTHPHTLEEYQSKFDWSIVDKLRSDGFRSWDTETCGLHVHVSRTAFGSIARRSQVLKAQAHELRFMKLIYDNQHQVERLAGRRSNHYATFEDKGNLVRKVKDGYQSNGRYSVINTENEATLEVRIFRGSLKKERVLSAIELVTAGVEYTRDLKVTGANKALSWLQFVAYVAQNAEQYPNLFNTMEKTLSTERVMD